MHLERGDIIERTPMLAIGGDKKHAEINWFQAGTQFEVLWIIENIGCNETTQGGLFMLPKDHIEPFFRKIGKE